MKVRDWIFAAVLTLTFVYGILADDNNQGRIQQQLDEIRSTILQIQEQYQERYLAIQEQYITQDVIAPMLDRLASRMDELDDRVYQYEQDIRFWNEQVRALFGDANERYFKEGRGK